MAVLLIDTYSLFYRSFYGLPPLTTAAGRPTGALYGFSALLLKLLNEQAPEGVALALDLPAPSFRKTLYPEYKAGRAATPSPLREQLAALPDLLDALGFPRFSAAGFEADDVLAALKRELTAAGQSVLIASGDRDLLQLVDGACQVLFLGQRGKPPQRYDEAAVRARFGIPPASLPAYVALVGDASDNIPKLKGVGELTAQRLVATHGDIASLLAQLDALPDARLRGMLRDHADQLRASEALARLRDDVPLSPGPRFSAFTPAARERTQAIFAQLEFKSLIARVQGLAER